MQLSRITESKVSKTYDFIIIGGGISGAAVAYTASKMGYQVALFEKADYGGATSAATSKLIHGGLRYLANFELGLVRESLRERRILGNIAPNFVYPVSFLFPVYGGIINALKMNVGLTLYDILSFDKKNTWDKSKKLSNHSTFSLQETLEKEPKVLPNNFQKSMWFFDYQSITPERLTLAFLKSAVKHGADIANYAQVEKFILEDNTVKGVKVKDVIYQTEREYQAKIVINCAGTWADEVLQKINEKAILSHKVKRSEGIHIVTRKIAGDHVVSLQTKNGKHLMIMPWRNHSLIGTTDKEYFGNPDEYKVSKESINELLSGVNEHFGEKLTYKDILYSYGGLRPLVDDQTEGSYNASRKFELFDHAKDGLKGLITVEGGKYTTSRHLAHQVLKLVHQKWHQKLPEDTTANDYLTGCEIPDMNQFLQEQHQKYDAKFDSKTVTYISKNYGTESDKIFEIAMNNPEYAEKITEDGEILAEVVYAIQHESAHTLEDILLRRTGIGTLGKPNGETMTKIMDIVQKLLNWSNEQKEKNLKKIEEIYALPLS